jgi:hypothetical protein
MHKVIHSDIHRMNGSVRTTPPTRVLGATSANQGDIQLRTSNQIERGPEMLAKSDQSPKIRPNSGENGQLQDHGSVSRETERSKNTSFKGL